MKYLHEKKHPLDYTENQPQDLLYDAYNLTMFPLREDILLLFFLQALGLMRLRF